MRARLGRVLVSGSLAIGAAAAAPTGAHGAVTAGGCQKWPMHTVASGLGILESLLPDGRGGMLLSSSTNNTVERLKPNGTVTTVVAANSPGQLLPYGHQRVLFTTGDSSSSGALNHADGTLRVLDPATGKGHQYTHGLTMPNGMAIAPDGRAFVTRDIGSGTGVTKIGAARPHKVTTNWAPLNDTNGAAIDPRLHVLYVDRTFTPKATVWRIPLRHPHRLRQIANVNSIGSTVPKGLDGMTIGANGVLYFVGNGSGEVFSLNPRTHRACLLASGLQDPSNVAIGTGHGWRAGSLFVCGFDGTVRRLDPPQST